MNILDNPYWLNYPKPSPLGPADEDASRHYVDAWLANLTRDA